MALFQCLLVRASPVVCPFCVANALGTLWPIKLGLIYRERGPIKLGLIHRVRCWPLAR